MLSGMVLLNGYMQWFILQNVFANVLLICTWLFMCESFYKWVIGCYCVREAGVIELNANNLHMKLLCLFLELMPVKVEKLSIKFSISGQFLTVVTHSIYYWCLWRFVTFCLHFGEKDWWKIFGSYFTPKLKGEKKILLAWRK